MYTGMYARTVPTYFSRKLRESRQKTWSESDMGTVLSGSRVNRGVTIITSKRSREKKI